MALQWDVTKVVNYEQNFPDEGTSDNPQWNSATMGLVWAAIPCAWGWSITEANYREVFTRLNMYERTMGAMRSKDRTDLLFTLEEVKNHIGMTVNVSPKSSTKFHGDLAKMIRHESERELARQQEAATKQASFGRLASPSRVNDCRASRAFRFAAS
jgi:hypothetical protein